MPMPSAREADARFWSRVEKTPSCWLWRGGLSQGKPCAFITNGKRSEPRRWAWETFHGPVPERSRLWARCAQPLCLRPEPGHIEAIAIGTRPPMPRGGAHHLAGRKRLSWQEVLCLWALVARGFSDRRIGVVLRVHENTVQKILRGDQWGWLTRGLPHMSRRRGPKPGPRGKGGYACGSGV